MAKSKIELEFGRAEWMGAHTTIRLRNTTYLYLKIIVRAALFVIVVIKPVKRELA
jgi:hypothetical protein